MQGLAVTQVQMDPTLLSLIIKVLKFEFQFSLFLSKDLRLKYNNKKMKHKTAGLQKCNSLVA